MDSQYMLAGELGVFAHHNVLASTSSISSERLMIGALVAVVLGIVMRYVVLYDPNREMNLPPGPRPWPLIGNVLAFINADTIHAKLKELAGAHGPLYTVWIGSTPTVILSGIALTRDALVRQGRVFSSRPAKYSWRYFTDGHKTLLTSPESPYWQALRRIYSRRILSPEAFGNYMGVRMSEIGKSVEAIRRAQVSSSGEGFDPEPIIRMQMSNIISRMNFGDDFDGEGKEVPMGPGGSLISRSAYLEELCERYRAITSVSIAHLGDYIPSLRHLAASKAVYANYESLEAEVAAWMMPLVQSRRREMAADGYSPDPCSRENYIDIFLSLEGDEKLSDVEVMWILVELFMAATDTTTGTAHWAMAHCMAYPDEQKRLYDEIAGVVGHERAVEEADLPDLPYLQAFVKETLRIRSPVALGVPHATSENCQLDGYDIPANTSILIHTGSLSNDETIWDSPDEFRPARFLELTEPQKLAFIPFGLGRRSCPGMHMGLVQAQITVATFVQTFEWIPAGGAVDLTERLHFIVVPNTKLRASVRERSPPKRLATQT